MINFYQFVDPRVHPSALVCVGPQTSVATVFNERSFVKAFGRYCLYRDKRSGEIYIGVWGMRLASRFRRSMRERGVEFRVREKLPPSFVEGGHADSSKNWIV